MSATFYYFQIFSQSKNHWKYVFPDPSLTTHRVVVDEVDRKLEALKLHLSQDLEIIKRHIISQSPHVENYQLAFSKGNFKDTLKKISPIFQTT